MNGEGNGLGTVRAARFFENVADVRCNRRRAYHEFVRDLAPTDYGSHEYMVRDPEGHLWSVGTYQPFSEV